jgi:dTDP-4-dehydrorhamnose 3,5-epimerase
MDVIPCRIVGVRCLRPRVFGDARGFYVDTLQADALRAAGAPLSFVQESQSRSEVGVLRGLHYQAPPWGQGKLVRVSRGRIWDVMVDLRPASPTFGQWEGRWLDDVSHDQLWIPAGIAHGFRVAEGPADVHYRFDAPWHPAASRTLRWDDATVQVDWQLDGVGLPVLSARDLAGVDFATAAGEHAGGGAS